MAHLLFEVFKVGFLVEGDLRHVLEEPPDLDAAELDGRVQVQGLKVLLKVVVSHLHTHFSIPYIHSMKNQITAHKGQIVSLSADYLQIISQQKLGCKTFKQQYFHLEHK